MEQEIEFADSEHLAGQHHTYQEGCYECAKENRLLKAKSLVDNLREAVALNPMSLLGK